MNRSQKAHGPGFEAEGAGVALEAQVIYTHQLAGGGKVAKLLVSAVRVRSGEGVSAGSQDYDGCYVQSEDLRKSQRTSDGHGADPFGQDNEAAALWTEFCELQVTGVTVTGT